MANTLKSYMQEHYTDNEIDNIKDRANRRGKLLISLQQSVCNVVNEYARAHHHNFGQIKEGLHTSKGQTARILKGDSNFTLETLLKVADYTGKTPRIIFE